MHHSVSVAESKRCIVTTDPSDSEVISSFQIDNDPPQSDDRSDLSLDYLKALQCSACNQQVPLGQLDIHWDTVHPSSIIPESKRYLVLVDPLVSKSVIKSEKKHEITPAPSDDPSDSSLDYPMNSESGTSTSDRSSKYGQNINLNGSAPLVMSAQISELDLMVMERAMRPTVEVNASMLEGTVKPKKSSSKLMIPIASNIHTDSFNVLLSEVCDELDHQYNDDCDHFSSTDISQRTEWHDFSDDVDVCPGTPPPMPSLRGIPRQNSVIHIDKIFDCEMTIGFGSSCRVTKARNNVTGRMVALKQIAKGVQSGRLVSNERALLDGLGQHENIVNLYSVYETPDHYFLATELLTGTNCT